MAMNSHYSGWLLLEKAEEMLWFSNGWQNLVDHYSIIPGNFLIFKYQGRSTFSIFIYDMTSTEIHYPSCTLTSSAAPKEEMDGHDSLENLGSSRMEKECIAGGSNSLYENDASTSQLSETVGKPRAAGDHSNQCEFVDLDDYVGKTKFHQIMDADAHKGTPRRHKVLYSQSRHSVSPCVANGKHNSEEWSVVKSEDEVAKLGIRSYFREFFMTTKLTSQEKEKAIHAARMFTSKNPSFMVIIRQMSLTPTYLVSLPIKFCGSYMRAPGIKVELEVLNERWPVYTIRRGVRSLSLSRGWAAFANKNCLSVGDICVFELVQIKDMVLRVSIFRANEDAAKKHAPTNQRSTT